MNLNPPTKRASIVETPEEAARKRRPPSAIGIILSSILLIAGIIPCILIIYSAVNYAFFMNEPHEGTVMTWEAAGTRTRATRSPNPGSSVFDYTVKENTTGRILNVKHSDRVYDAGDSVIVYTHPGGSAAHFLTGFEAFFSDDRTDTDSASRLLVFSFIALPVLVLFLAHFVKKWPSRRR